MVTIHAWNRKEGEVYGKMMKSKFHAVAWWSREQSELKSLEDRSEEQWPMSRLSLNFNLRHFCWNRGHLAVMLKSHFHFFPALRQDIKGKTHSWITCLWLLREFDHLCMMIHKRWQSNIVSVAAKSPEKREERTSMSLMWYQPYSPRTWDTPAHKFHQLALEGHHWDFNSVSEQRLGKIPVGTQVSWRAVLHAF